MHQRSDWSWHYAWRNLMSVAKITFGQQCSTLGATARYRTRLLYPPGFLPAGPAKRSQTGIHRQTSAQPGPARPHVCCGQRIVYQRGGQPSVVRTAAARARAWVSRNQFGNAPCTWNIDSIVCCQTNSLTCISCSCQTDDSQSEEKLRKQRIQPRK